MEFLKPDKDAVAALAGSYPQNTPVVMLNLLKFLAQAKYPASAGQAPCTGAEAFQRYVRAVTPLIAACGGERLWQGSQAAMLIGPQDKQWHLAVLVRYPSVQAFMDMISSTEYQKIALHRDAALEDSRLIAHREL